MAFITNLFSYIVWYYLLRNICLSLTIICTFVMQIPKPKLPTKWEEYAKQKVQKLKFLIHLLLYYVVV